MNYAFITLGETMLRLTPPGHQLIEQAQSLQLYVGGSESNVAVGLARLGHRVAWISRMTDNPLGRRIAADINALGVETSHITWTTEDRIGTYYVEEGPPPRGSTVIYDRAGSAMSRMQPADLPESLFIQDRPGVFHVSGITLAIGSDAARTAIAAASQAKAAGWRISFDVNYRSKLWDIESAVLGCASFNELADIVFIAHRDAIALYDAPVDTNRAVQHMRTKLNDRLIVLTRGADGAICCTPDGHTVTTTAFAAHGSGRVGGGDAFAAGFLSRYIETNSVDQALRWGAAAAAYKYTIPGDMPLINRDQLRDIIVGAEGIQR